MIGRVAGLLLEKAPPRILVDVQGLGYELEVPMSTFYQLGALGAPVVLLTHFVVREDAQLLFGFLTEGERRTFRELVKVSGVGPRTALAVLSGLSTDELAQAVVQQSTARLVKVPGIGKKTAERLVMELKDKVGLEAPGAVTAAAVSAPAAEPTPAADAVAALIALGFKAADADKGVRTTIGKLGPGATADQLVRAALGR